MVPFNKKTEFNFQTGEVILINKPLGWTSFDVVNKIRYLLRSYTGIRKIKVGHAGTLDPLASGLLILCTGKFTKKIEEFQGLEKEYTGTFHIGATTPSYDRETEIDQNYETGHVDEKTLINATRQFIGNIDQVPPLFSALKIKGKRAYELARGKEDVKLSARKVTINAFELTHIDIPKVAFRISCGKGTYIRSIAHDFGQAINSGAHLSSLIRTKIGSFNLEDSLTIEQFNNIINPQNVS
ncbi:MAG: tRNA pseudouridine(55) synthase TruB [Bacteroidetes bacterium]|nr:MAG: tRNA pseudouridine(55) synthase TruB [Bacteroidota bacterium]